MRNALLALALMLTLCGTAGAQWKVVGTGAERGPQRGTALVENRDGHSFSVHREADGSVWGSFSIPQSASAQLAADQAPAYQVDAFPPRDLGRVMRLQEIGGLRTYAWEPHRVSFVLSLGGVHEVNNEALEQLMQGKHMVVRYMLAGGGSAEARFTLNAARSAIGRALDIPIRNDAALVEHRAKFDFVFRDAMRRCSRLGAGAKDCVDRALTCARQPRSNDLQVFRACAG